MQGAQSRSVWKRYNMQVMQVHSRMPFTTSESNVPVVYPGGGGGGGIWVSKHFQVINYSLPNLIYGSLCGSIARSSDGRRPVKTQQTQEPWAHTRVLATRTVHTASINGSTVPSYYVCTTNVDNTGSIFRIRAVVLFT